MTNPPSAAPTSQALAAADDHPPAGHDSATQPLAPDMTDELLPTDAALDAVESLAAVTLAPVAELRHSPWLLRAAMACQVAATVAVGATAWSLDLPDWWVFLAMGVATTVLVGNIMRWRRRWGWIRRTVLTAFSCSATLVWLILLIDRAQAGTRNLTRDDAASPWFWLPATLLVAALVLLVLHFVIGTRRDRAWVRQLG